MYFGNNADRFVKDQPLYKQERPIITEDVAY